MPPDPDARLSETPVESAACALEAAAAALRSGDAPGAVEKWQAAEEALCFSSPHGLGWAILQQLNPEQFGRLWLRYMELSAEAGPIAAAAAVCDAVGLLRVSSREIAARYYRARMSLLRVVTPAAFADLEALGAAFPGEPPEALIGRGLELQRFLFTGAEWPAWLSAALSSRLKPTDRK